jgi:hypothetical protein
MGRTSSINVCKGVAGTARSQKAVAGTWVFSQRSEKRCKDTWALNVDLKSHFSLNVLATL